MRKYFRIRNGITNEEKFVVVDKDNALDFVNIYAMSKLKWLYQLTIVEVDENKQPKRGGDFYLHCVREYYEDVYKTKDYDFILRSELKYAIDTYKNRIAC